MSRRVQRVMVVDDHEIVRTGVRSLLTDHPDFEVVADASAGDAGLIAARVAKPDIAIIDYSMPGLNGLQLTIALKQTMPAPAILLYTRNDREELVLEVIRAGARGYVRKSDPEADLVKALRALSIGGTFYSPALPPAAIDRALSPVRGNKHHLTDREREIVCKLAEGNTSIEVSNILGISVKTVETHRAAVSYKLGMRNWADVVRYGLRNDIVAV